ncbi:MAG: rod shape-determining protein [Candidatus Izimaplasma sp.]|nr:rod shape-determining protein [Candidatus Izimaplasma bacterium]
MGEKAKGKMNVGVDLGTSNLLIYVEGRGTVFNEPSIIAIDKASKKVVSVGYEAAGLLGKVHDKVEVIKPLNGGVISDIDMIREILLFTFNKIFMSHMENINKLLICIPSEITDTEKAAIMVLGKELGIENTFIDEEIKAAALGGGIDIYTASGHLVVDIGGGTTDFGVLSLGEVVNSKSIKVAGDYFDKQISNYVKEHHKLEIGPQTAEKIKLALASLTGDLPVDEEGTLLTYSAMGRDLVTGLPQQVSINAKEIRKILLSCFESIKATLIATLESTLPELSGDLVDNGIQITGGGAQIKGIKKYFEDITGVDVQISKFPMTAVVNGTKKLLKIDKKHYFGEF